jgi:hypothetical protein
VSHQVLPRQRSEAPPEAGGAAARTAATAAGAPLAPERTGRPLRRPAVLALVAGATVVLAGLGWMLLRAPGTARDESAAALARPQIPVASGSPSTASPSPAGDSYAGDAEGAVPGRDPFEGDAGRGAPATQAPPDSVAPGTAATPVTSPDAAPIPVPPASPQGGVPAGPTTYPVVTTTVTSTLSPTVMPTTTVTAPGSAIYVGFYAWNGDRASFRVNTRTFSYPVGTTFGPQLTFTAVRPGTPRCAVLGYQGKAFAFTLCPGQVVRLP